MPWAVVIISLLCTAFLILSLSICRVLGLCPVLLESFSRSCCLSLYLRVSYLCSPEVSTLQNLHWSLWVDFCFEKEGDKDLVSFLYTWIPGFSSITCWRGCGMYVFNSFIVVVVSLIPLRWPAYLFLNHYCGSWPLWLTGWLETRHHNTPSFAYSAYDWFCSLGPFMLLFEFWFANSVEMSLGFGWRMHWIFLVLSVTATFRVLHSASSSVLFLWCPKDFIEKFCNSFVRLISTYVKAIVNWVFLWKFTNDI